MNILFDWCGNAGVRDVLGAVKTILNVIHWIVPIGLVIMTAIDIFKKVINPDEKEAQKKIMTRIIAAVLVFAAPIMVRLVIRLVDVGLGNKPGTSSSIGECWGD